MDQVGESCSGSTRGLLDLPDEILMMSFAKLWFDDLENVQLVCRRTRDCLNIDKNYTLLAIAREQFGMSMRLETSERMTMERLKRVQMRSSQI